MVTVHSDLGAQENKTVTLSTFPPSMCHEMAPDAMILFFWMLSFNLAFLLSSFTFIKRLFSSSLLSVIGMVPSTYLRLLTFLLLGNRVQKTYFAFMNIFIFIKAILTSSCFNSHALTQLLWGESFKYTPSLLGPPIKALGWKRFTFFPVAGERQG